MKKIWSAPEAIAEQFAANEYVAACGDENKVYKFVCNAPKGDLYYYPNSDGTLDGVYNGTGRASYIGSYSPCAASHDAPYSSNQFHDGFVDYNDNGKHDADENVIVWRHPRGGFLGGWNGHATKELNMTKWETAKS